MSKQPSAPPAPYPTPQQGSVGEQPPAYTAHATSSTPQTHTFTTSTAAATRPIARPAPPPPANVSAYNVQPQPPHSQQQHLPANQQNFVVTPTVNGVVQPFAAVPAQPPAGYYPPAPAPAPSTGPSPDQDARDTRRRRGILAACGGELMSDVLRCCGVHVKSHARVPLWTLLWRGFVCCSGTCCQSGRRNLGQTLILQMWGTFFRPFKF
eukprot:m.40040 g.40040  ORF g.40040 m.40040 type:complete len:209 (-) comp10386_c0_seq2:652-1278(-)